MIHPNRSRTCRALALATALPLMIAWGGARADGSAAVARRAVPEATRTALGPAKPRALPTIAIIGPDGRRMTLAHFRGRTVLLNLWATWCPPCREEMPSLDALQARLGGPRFTVVALAIDGTTFASIARFFARRHITHLKAYVDADQDADQRLGVFGIPTTLLIDAKGREIARRVGPTDWNSAEMIALLRSMIARHGAARSARPARPRPGAAPAGPRPLQSHSPGGPPMVFAVTRRGAVRVAHP